MDIALDRQDFTVFSAVNATAAITAVHQRLWAEGWLYFQHGCGRFCMRRGGLVAAALVPGYDPKQRSPHFSPPYVDIYKSFGPTFKKGNRSCSTLYNCRYPVEWLLPLSRVTLHGRSFPAPSKPRKVLAQDYGSEYNQTAPMEQTARGNECDHNWQLLHENPCWH